MWNFSWCIYSPRIASQLQRAYHLSSNNTRQAWQKTNLLVSSKTRTLHCTVHIQATRKSFSKDDTIPFLQSKARKFKVDDAYSVDTARDQSRQKFALPLGVGIFTVVMYFGFFRDYGTKDKSIVGFLTKDIGDKLPGDVRQRIYSEVDQSKLSDRPISGTNDK